MSAKRSFDIGRKQPVERTQKKKTKARTASRAKTERRPAPKKLRARREDERKRTQLLTFAILLLVVGIGIYGLWRPEVRIQNIHVQSIEDEASVASLVQQELSGTYYHFIPKDSFFFYPAKTVRQAILDAYPRISAIQVRRDGFTGVEIQTENREVAFLWCGEPEHIGASETFARENCYEADTYGYIFKPADIDIATTTSYLLVRGFIDTASTTPETAPLRALVVGSNHLPAVLNFIQSVQSLGTPIVSVTIRNDEVDLYAPSNTRITYVLGSEEQAQKDARAAFPTINLMDGSLEYVDLRFPGKVYLKRNE